MKPDLAPGTVNDEFNGADFARPGPQIVTAPSRISAKRHAAVEKMSGLSGADFDKAYVAAMVPEERRGIFCIRVIPWPAVKS